MQPKFTLKKFGKIFGLTPMICAFLFLLAGKTNAQSVIYQTTNTSVNGAEITAAANGAATSMGDAIVLAGTNRFINKVEVSLFTLASAAPFSLTLSMYTDCSTSGATGACGSGAGTLIPGTTVTITGVTPPAIGTLFTATFNYAIPPNLASETDNQINVVINASRNDVFWILNETPTIGSVPPGDPVGGVVTRCGSTAGNNGCARVFAGAENNFNMKITASATGCAPVNATAPTISSVPSTTCAGSPITLSVIAGNLNGAADWKWYSGTCGGTLVGTGPSITVSPVATTTYFARGEGGCAPGNGPCGSQVVTVTPCTCITPDAATICLGTVQRLAVNQTLPATLSAPFTKVGVVNIPGTGTGAAGGTPANPYPDVLAVSGLPVGASINSVTLNNFSHTFPGDVDIVLRSPSGASVILMSDIGGGTDAVNANLTFSDAGAVMAAPIVTGTFKPANAAGPDDFVAPGPGSITQVNPTLASVTGSANGNWELFIVDQAGGDIGTISGWSMTFNIPATTATWTGPAGTLFTNAAGTQAYVAATPASVVYSKPSAVGANAYVATVNNGPCAGANNVTVTALATPVVTVSPNPGGCSPAVLTASGASIYNWSPATGLSSTTGATVTATTGVDATYTVSSIGANGCSAAPVTVAVPGSSTSAIISSLGAPPITIWNEGLDGAVPPAGWASKNNSVGLGASVWNQGGALGVFPPQSGAGFASVNFNSTTGAGTISNWLFTAVTNNINNGDLLTFWARANDGTPNGGPFPDRLQVRLSSNGSSTDVGTTATSTGDFGTLLLDINPTLTTTGFPFAWTQFTATVTGLSGPASGRFAFRYFVTDGGPAGNNSDFIGVDNVSFQKPPLATCAFNTSAIKVDITGGTSPYTVIYSDGTTNRTVTNYTSGTPIQVTPGVTTTYTIVSVTGANSCAGSGNTGSATITVTPPPAITAQPVNRTICDGQNTTFTVTATPPLGTTYQWQISTNGGTSYSNLANGGVYSGATTATLTLTGATTALNNNRYRVVVTGVCPPATVTSTAGILTINVAPTITTQPVATTKCLGTTATFSVVATGNTPTYQWQVSTNSGLTYTNVTGATAATLTLTGITQAMNNNLYQVIVTVAPCATTVTSTPAKLTVTPLPVITIAAPVTQLIPGRTTTITATSTPGPLTPASYSWTLNGTAVAGATSNTVSVDIDKIGVYRASVTDVNGCVATSTALTIGTEASDKLWIYPNPTDGVFQVRLFQATDAYTRREVSVWNSNGQMVDRKTFDFVRGMSPYYSMNFDLSKAAPGTYLVKVTEKVTMRIVSGLVVVQ